MMNRVILVGRLTKDPELRYTGNGTAVASFTLAVKRNFKNGEGEYETDFINCVVWRKPAENAANYLKRGSLAGVDGRVQTRNYEGDNGRVYVTEILAESVQFLEPRSSNTGGDVKDNTITGGNGYISVNEQQQKDNGYQSRTTNNSYTRVNDDPFSGNDNVDDIDSDDLPF